MKKYIFMGSASKDFFCIDGINLFKYKWITTGDCVTVLDPTNKKPYIFTEYKIVFEENEILFAAGKFENQNWGFYKQKNI